MSVYAHSFHHLRPHFEFPQEVGLKWLAQAHLKAEQKKNPSLDWKEFSKKLQERIDKVACKSEHIETRGYSIPGIEGEGEFFGAHLPPEGACFGVRNRLFDNKASEAFIHFYKEGREPSDLIHVTCTGYISPSPAQKLIAQKGWKSRVLNAYHMGCFGSVPAIRMAQGLLAAKSEAVDVVHTELCSLHFNPSAHDDEQLVSQSLFADGFIKYTLSHEKRGFRLLAIEEELVPDTADKMTWGCEEWGLRMTLSREVPYHLSRVIAPFVERLGKADYFAIHPGGPKIIDQIQKRLQLADDQLMHSRTILRRFGNMSSATLPHIWEMMEKDLKVGDRVIGLAFGPGLMIVGILLEKV